MTATLTSATTVDTLVNLAFAGTATLGTSYDASSELIVIPAGATSGSITLTGNDVAIGTAPETVQISIASVLGANQATPQQVTANLNPGTVASGLISGKVIDTSNNPIAGVTVFLGAGPFNPSVNVFTTTDANGNYSFAGLAANTYTVQELVPHNFQLTVSPTPVILAEGQQQTLVNFTNAAAPETANLSVGNQTFTTTGAGKTDTVTLSLLAPAGPGGVTAILGFSGTAVANTDYSIANGSNAIIAAGSPVEIVIPAGQSTGSIVFDGTWKSSRNRRRQSYRFGDPARRRRARRTRDSNLDPRQSELPADHNRGCGLH